MRFYLISFLMMILCLSLMSQEMTNEQRIQQLQERIAQQQQVLQDLTDQVSAREQLTRDYTENMIQEYLQNASAEESQGITAGYNKGFFVKSEDDNFKMNVVGYMRNNLFLFEANTSTDNTFRVTEARLDFNFYLFKDWHIRIRPDFAPITDVNHNILRDVYLEYLGWDCLRFRIGAFVTSFSLEAETNPADLIGIAFSPYLTSIPVRDVGFTVSGFGLPFLNSSFLSDHFFYSAGLFNGQGLNRIDRNDGKMFLGTARIFPIGRENDTVFIQSSFFYSETDFTEDGAAIRLPGILNHEVFGRETATGAEDPDDVGGNTIGVSGGFRYWKDNLRVEGEILRVRYNRNIGGQIAQRRHPLDMWAASAGMSYFIPIGNPDNKMGLEPLVKFSYTDIDDKDGDGSAATSAEPNGTPGDVRGQDVWEIVVGAKFHMNKHFRMDFNWVMYDLGHSRGLNNSDSGNGGGLIHAFVFQWLARW